MDTLNRKFNPTGNLKISSVYDPPQRKTSAEIISEARHAIRESQLPDNSYNGSSIRPLQTQRPFTPRENERHLFGKRGKTNRPPSTFSLRYLQNETYTLPQTLNGLENPILSPSLLTNSKSEENFSFIKQRSNSISEINDNKIFNIGLKELPPSRKLRLPALDKPLPRRKLIKNATSLDKLPEEADEIKPPQYRNAFSSPQEPTECNQNKSDSPFGRPSKQQSLSRCLLLGPQNLDKIFGNQQIIENSTTLFIQKVLDSKEKSVDDIINCLNLESNKHDNEETIVQLLDEFYNCLDRENLLQIKISSKLKINILKCLYKFVESANERILLGIARIILAIKVTGNNLSGVCKLIFKVAKTDSNDYLFLDKNILELFLDSLGRSSPIDDAEACIYAYGTVKFLTMNNKLVEKIISLGILDLMALHMKIINTAKTDKLPLNDQTGHVLYQLTGALRNLASEEHIYAIFNKSGATDQLCTTMEVFVDDLDIMSNISRTISNITTNETCCDKIVENKKIYKIFIHLFEKYSGTEEVIVRLTYSMGNIVAKIDGTRIEFYKEKNSINCLLNLWKIYLERTLKNCSLLVDNEKEVCGSAEDVMIKVIRIIANIVINPEIGKDVNENYGTKLVDELLKVLISNPFKKNQELVLSVLSTLNNLSYYYTSEIEQDIFHVRQVDLAEGIAEYAKSPVKDCVIESMRILGNLSRSKVTRSYISDSEIFQTLIECLKTDDILCLKTCIGVFVNLMADNKSRNLFRKLNGVSQLIKILDTYGQSDWLMGTLICQALWNYAIDCLDLYELFTDEEIQKLLVILADYLDDEKIFGIKDDIDDSEIFSTHEYLIWDEFANVATNLLEKIEYFLDTFDQIQLDEKDQIKMKDSSTNLSFAAW